MGLFFRRFLKLINVLIFMPRVFILAVFVLAFVFLLSLSGAGAFELECDEEPLKNVLKKISVELKINILADPAVTELKASFALRNVSAYEALELVLKTYGLSYNHETENTITVFKAADAARYREINAHLFKVNYISPEKAVESLKLVYPDIDFSADNSRGTIFAAGHFDGETIDSIKSKIKLFDERPVRVKLEYELISVSAAVVADEIVVLRRLYTREVKASSAEEYVLTALERILSRSKSITKAFITLIPSNAESGIKRVVSVPYAVSGSSGEITFARAEAGDIFAARLISASPEGAVVEFSIDASSFIGGASSGYTPPPSYSRKIKSVIAVKNGERLLAGELSASACDKIISCGERICVSDSEAENEPVPIVINDFRRNYSSGDEKYFIYIRAFIER